MALAVRGVARLADRPAAGRIGIDTGPVMVAVIGRPVDLWGDTVSTASRMESNGVAGCIQVTDRAYRRLRDRYRFERRGPVQVKGKGELVTWFLLDRAVSPAEPRGGQ
jgi:class 3 adenylate cyclase